MLVHGIVYTYMDYKYDTIRIFLKIKGASRQEILKFALTI